jgi:hypothetical protein
MLGLDIYHHIADATLRRKTSFIVKQASTVDRGMVRMCRILARFEKIMLGKMQCNLTLLQLPKIKTTFGRKLLFLGKALGHSLTTTRSLTCGATLVLKTVTVVSRCDVRSNLVSMKWSDHANYP